MRSVTKQLTWRFRTMAGAVTLCLLMLAAIPIGQSYHDYRLSIRTQEELRGFRALLDAANALSAERGPANAGMAATDADADPSAALDSQRRQVDAALAAIEARPLPGREAALLAGARRALAAARLEVDRVRATPHAGRTLAGFEQAVAAMFGAWDGFREVVDVAAASLVARDEALFPAVFAGTALMDLREQAGRAGSNVIAPIALRQPMPAASLAASRTTRGQLAALWRLSAMPDDLLADPARLRRMRAEVERRFLGDGLGLVDAMIAQGLSGSGYGLTAAAFTERFVATFGPVLRLQSAAIDAAAASLAAKRRAAVLRLAALSAMALALIGLAMLAVVQVERHLFRPLLRARDEVLAVALDEPDEGSAPPAAMNEIAQLFTAIRVLRERMRQRRRLIHELRQIAATDSLTGLPNRAALEQAAVALGTSPDRMATACLLLVDIDRFKSINDRHGHLAGDHVVRAVACRLRDAFGGSGTVARFGGDEFAALAAFPSPADATAKAEALRHDICARPIGLPDQEARVAVSVSIGLAFGAHDWTTLVRRADAALYEAKAAGRNATRVASP
ncbi:GGDEF domain-containing protein [Roseomonas sp. NAR14]|uniref:diguanylate cyclase n=1 Tax=Roseomonas acroporae TaxID=2937791 RepID=A0A9X1YA89_9PROT|nr:GGDEF domain-containing protein [Roseomonas acroporae]MCK8786774.1 GGDEF domain-containing protein [Roseomonas acroporae]